MAKTTSFQHPDSHNPRRHIGYVGLLFASIGSIIGSGWLFGALNAARQAGPASLIAWPIGAIMMLLIALTYAELGTMFPLSGGVVRFPHMSYGHFTGYLTGWIAWLGIATTAPIEVEAVLQYATKYANFTTQHTVNGEIVHTLTSLGYIAAAVLMAIFVVINYFGIRWFARINNALVWWKLVIIVLVIVALAVAAFHSANFTSMGFKPEGWHGVFTAIATAGIVFSYLGFRQAIELAGETDNPKRNVPFAVIGSVLITAVIYIALQAAFIGALAPHILAKSGSWAALNFANDFGPLAGLATLLGLGWLAVLLHIDAIVSPGDTGLIYITSTSRVIYGMGKNNNVPPSLAKTTRRGVPLIGLLIAFVVGLIMFLPFPSWQQLVGFITSATVMSFASGPLAVSAMRKQIPQHPRPFRLPGGHIIPFLALWSSNLIIFWSGWSTVWRLMVAILLGLVLLIFFQMRHDAPRLDFLAGASWYLPWLGGLTVISWLGDFGGIGVLGFGVSIPVLLGLSILIYVIAQFSRLGSGPVQEHIDQTVTVAELEEEEVGSGSA
jgi:amino acid transporter